MYYGRPHSTAVVMVQEAGCQAGNAKACVELYILAIVCLWGCTYWQLSAEARYRPKEVMLYW